MSRITTLVFPSSRRRIVFSPAGLVSLLGVWRRLRQAISDSYRSSCNMCAAHARNGVKSTPAILPSCRSRVNGRLVDQQVWPTGPAASACCTLRIAAMKFVLVNGRTPRAQSSCELCGEPIGEAYLRDITSRLAYCGHDCYLGHRKLRVPRHSKSRAGGVVPCARAVPHGL